MFQLIVAVISIALVAALAIASLYYGGQAFQKSSLKANVTTLVNAGQQVAGADALYKTDNSGVGIADGALGASVIPEYLAATPGKSGAAATAGVWTIESVVTDGVDGLPATADDETIRLVSITVNADAEAEICAEVNKQAGLAETAAFNGDVPAAQFGCFGDAGSEKFGFKL